MTKVGYARVSSVGQSLDVQREKLANCDKLFEEKRSATTDARPQLKECLNYVRDGDRLIVTRIDRLARSTLHLCQIAETLREKRVGPVVDHVRPHRGGPDLFWDEDNLQAVSKAYHDRVKQGIGKRGRH